MPAAEKSMHLDRIIASNKNMRDVSLIDIWLNQSVKIMQRIKLDPLPQDRYIDPSEAGTDLSQALTANETFDGRRPPDDTRSPPPSPPWRAQNEGGIIAVEPPPGAGIETPTHFAHAPYLDSDSHSSSNKAANQGSQEGAKEGAKWSDSQGHRTKPPTPPPMVEPEMKQVTLGFTLGKCESGGMKVLRIKDGGVIALHGKMKVGDRIQKIDGEDLTGLSALEVNRLVVGPEGSVAEILYVGVGKEEGAAAEKIFVTRKLPARSTTSFGVVTRAPAAGMPPAHR